MGCNDGKHSCEIRKHEGGAISASGSSISRDVGSWVSAQFHSGSAVSGSAGSWDLDYDTYPFILFQLSE